MPRIAKVVVDIAVNREFDYLIPESLQAELEVGAQVVVPFGRTETQGFVVGLAEASAHKGLKAIVRQVGGKSLISESILTLARWMADYYVAPVEHAIRTVLPSAVRRKGASFKEQIHVRATSEAAQPGAVEQLARRAPKQAAALTTLLERGPMFAQALVRAAGSNMGSLRALEDKGLVEMGLSARERDPFADEEVLSTKPHDLMPEQAQALEMVMTSMKTLNPSVILLHGVTGSGKTEVYLQAIRQVVDAGKGAIVLVPEIALTPQTVDRFRSRFGGHIAVLHSNLSQGERHDEWHRIHDGRATIVVGARSALFAPVKKLGLIIVDEEHEPTYKQEESPRYNARDVAVMRGHMEKCVVVLGSATPSLESYANAKRGKYGLARLTTRVDDRAMPAMRIVDMRTAVGRSGRPGIISEDLRNSMQDRLARAEQTMLFLNRRGFSTSLVCEKCGYVAECEDCSVSMTYHRREEMLRCHICGGARGVPGACPECQDPQFKFSGVGTQKIEEIVGKLFRGAKVERMDSDTMTRKDSYRVLLGDFRTGKIDILIGTQMIAKGLHFPNVTLVGVVLADLSLHVPDFRAGERTFQLLTQVAGRAGRGDIRGDVVVQTYTPFHPAIQAARRLDYEGFCDEEMEFRRELGYPPFGHLVCVTIRGKSEEKVSFSAETFARALQPLLPDTVVMGDATPAPLARAKGNFRYQVILRAPLTKQMTGPLRGLLETFKWPDKVLCMVDVDALSLL